MKKLVCLMLTVLACEAAYALPVSNPSEASLLTEGFLFDGNCCCIDDPCFNWCNAFSLRIGFYGDYVFNRHMKVGSFDTDIAEDHGSSVEHFELYTNAGYVALNFCNRIDLFATLGASSLAWDTNANDFVLLTTLDQRLQIETESTFSWSVGARATLWECAGTALGIEGQYFSFRPNTKRITYADSESIYPDETGEHHEFSDWQIGLGLSRQVYMFVPYAALRWGHARYHQDAETFALPQAASVILPNFSSSTDWGYAFGVSLVDCERALLTLEARFASEKALYINGQVRF